MRFKTRKRIFALLTASVMAAAALPAMPVQAAGSAPQYDKIVILGDSISTRYALASGESSYYEILSDFTGAGVTNYAVSGYTTSDLLTLLEDESKQAAIKEADLICISIGSNDILKPAHDYFDAYRQEGELFMDIIKRLAKDGDPKYYIGQLTAATRDARAQAIENYPLIETALRDLNPDAEIVMESLYNPFEVRQQVAASYSEDNEDMSNYEELMRYISNMENQLSKAMRNLETVKVAEVGNAYANAGWAFVGSGRNDVHPTETGHAMIAAVIMDLLGITGKTSDVFTRSIENMIMGDYRRVSENSRKLLHRYANPGGRLFGDADDDGKIAAEDAQIVLQRYTKGLASLSSAADFLTYEEFNAVDVTGDGEADVADAQCILQYFTINLSQKTVKWSELTGNPNAPD
ncbi:MAG: hypothetical protein IJ060_12620 [Oscillospiraceae bacterium]|nr:hypothetical protein [Oscillospiraceae bacterium]